MFEQLSQQWHLIPDTVDAAQDRPPSGCDTVDSTAVTSSRDTENDNTSVTSKRPLEDTVDNGQDDVDGFFQSKKPRTDGSAPQSAAAGALAQLPCYNMGHKKRGKFVIINNEIFEPQTYAGRRLGTDVDAEALNKVFTKIGFSVQLEKDQTAQQMKQLIEQVAKENHADCDCLGIAVLSHGTTEDVLYGTDKLISLTELIEPLKNCPTLNGKPKLIFIQACRGEKLIPPVNLSADVTDLSAKGSAAMDEDDVDGPRKPQRIPREADFLYVHATPPGHFAWRNTSNGSWFIQALCKQMEAFAYELDLVTLLTLVNNQVAYDYQSATGNPATNDMRQVSSVVSMLTKMLWLKPKK